MALSTGDTTDANRYIENLRTIRKSWDEARILAQEIAPIYSEAGIQDKAGRYYRQAFLLDPENPARMNSLAYFLIDKNQNTQDLNEGLELIDKVLKLKPENFSYLHTKGWGLYKKGKYQEALEILQKSWDLRMKNAIYYHEALLHLDSAKKAVARQK